MTITREQVADLQPGDVVEIREDGYPDIVTRGPLHTAPNGALDLGGIYRVRSADGSVRLAGRYSVTVVSRAPRPLYVNHPRTEPVPGDVVRGADQALARDTWTWNEHRGAWSVNGQSSFYDVSAMPKRLRLLVDGETGQVVP